jgi:hypothetical protein
MHTSRTIAALLLCLAIRLPAKAANAAPAEGRFRGALVTAEMVTADRLAELKAGLFVDVVLLLGEPTAEAARADADAAERVKAAGLRLHYWIEVGRCPALADEHPEWIASLQGHQEWRRLHPGFPQPKSSEVVKCYPWTPILYREAFAAHLRRIERLLADRPPPRSLLLNDLQGPPTACGCGNPVCRWTADYGPIKTATAEGDDAAARFVAKVEALAGDKIAVIPIWTTECEEHDVAKDALCAGVGCFKGICWKAYTRQLKSLSEQSPTIGALLLYKEFGQDTNAYREPAGWVGHALRGFRAMPPKHGGKAVEPQRLIAVLQGWDVTPEQLAAQRSQAEAVGAGGMLVAFAKIDQSWSPKIHTWR